MLVFKKEKKTIKLAERYIATMFECVASARDAIRCFLGEMAGDPEELCLKVRQLESSADAIRLEIRNTLYSGAYVPLIREDIHKVIALLDRVANAAEAACDFVINQKPDIPETLHPAFKEILKVSFGITKPLKKGALDYFEPKGKMDAVREHAQEVGRQESEVDELESNLTKAIFDSTRFDLSRKLHLQECLNRITAVSDRAEDAADQLELSALKSVV